MRIGQSSISPRGNRDRLERVAIVVPIFVDIRQGKYSCIWQRMILQRCIRSQNDNAILVDQESVDRIDPSGESAYGISDDNGADEAAILEYWRRGVQAGVFGISSDCIFVADLSCP